MTAAAICMVALAGCSTGNDAAVVAPAAPAATSTVATDPVGQANDKELMMNDSSVNESADGGPVVSNPSAVNYAQPVANPQSVVITDTATQANDRTLASNLASTTSNSSTQNVTDTMMMDDGSKGMADGSVMTDPVTQGNDKELAMNDADVQMKKDAMAADSGNAAFDTCFAGGGQVVNFIGDPSGATMACEVDGVQTIL